MNCDSTGSVRRMKKITRDLITGAVTAAGAGLVSKWALKKLGKREKETPYNKGNGNNRQK